MSRYIACNPDQNWLLPPSLRDELGDSHMAVFLHELVERLDLSRFEAARGDSGRPAYPPQMMLKIWLYAYTLGVTSSRRIEERVREDLDFRFLAGSLKPDHWTLNDFRRRHPHALNDVFTQVLESARRLGMGRLGVVAIDSTRVAANASPDRSSTARTLRRERARIRQRIRRWQKQCDHEDGAPEGTAAAAPKAWQERLEEIPRHLEQLRKSGSETRVAHRSGKPVSAQAGRLLSRVCGGDCGGRRSPDCGAKSAPGDYRQRFAGDHDRGGGARMRQRPEAVLADCRYYSMDRIREVQARGIAVCVPDRLMATELAGGAAAPAMNDRQRRRTPGLQELRERMRDPVRRSCYARRKALVEPVFGVLKQQRGMRQFRRRGLDAVATEWALATTAYNLTRLFRRSIGP